MYVVLIGLNEWKHGWRGERVVGCGMVYSSSAHGIKGNLQHRCVVVMAKISGRWFSSRCTWHTQTDIGLDACI